MIRKLVLFTEGIETLSFFTKEMALEWRNHLPEEAEKASAIHLQLFPNPRGWGLGDRGSGREGE